MNALKHGLATPEHILLEGEDEAAFTTLHETLIEENEPESATETQLVHRLAVTFWKQARADRLEAKLLANTDPPRFITSEGIEPGDPEAFFDLRRFNAIRGYQAQLSREVSRCLAELRRLRRAHGLAARAAANENEPDEPCRPSPWGIATVVWQPSPGAAVAGSTERMVAPYPASGAAAPAATGSNGLAQRVMEGACAGLSPRGQAPGVG
jgi:hypothetical protein